MVAIDGVTPGLLAAVLPAVVAETQRALRSTATANADGADLPRTLGVPDGAKAAVVAALAQIEPGPILVITPRPSRAQALLEEVRSWIPDDERRPVLHFPARETLPYESRRDSGDAVQARLRVLASLAAGECPLIISDVQAISQGTLHHDAVLPALRVGDILSTDEFTAALDAAGYRSAIVVDQPGSFARRGGIIDVFPATDAAPVRIELFGDQIESLRRFDPVTQRSVDQIDRVSFHAATEAAVDDEARAMAAALHFNPADGPARTERDQRARDIEQITNGALPRNLTFWSAFLTRGVLWDHLPAPAVVIWDEAEEARLHLDELDVLADHARETLETRGEIPTGLPPPSIPAAEFLSRLQSRRPRIDLRRFATDGQGSDGKGGDGRRMAFLPVNTYGGRLRTLIDDLLVYQKAAARVVLVSLQAPRLLELFQEYGLAVERGGPREQRGKGEPLSSPPAPGVITVAHGSVSHGWRLPPSSSPSANAQGGNAQDGEAQDGGEQIVITDTEIFGFAKQRRSRPRRRHRHDTFLEDLQPGDFVVHIEHGIAKFTGAKRERVGGRELEYLELQYAEGDRLLVPTDQLHRLQRYVGPSDRPPSLTRLDTQQWQRAKQRVRGAVRDIADELLQVYAARQVVAGIAAPPDSAWQMELEAAFPYVETPDQISAVRDVKADMERDRPMDRIVVGDVGYGKTEVAVRAAFKATTGGRQVAMLVPTTVLAQQHFVTFQERMGAFPVHIEMLSRFRSHAEQSQILLDLQDGKIDILIGTHRMLQKDVKFKSLGLLIIDEEQRFGVAHKEALKRMRSEVDVLTLSATPIPRTMHMALSGIRDMSTIETPPEERLPISTYVMESDDTVIRDAILRELERGGQTYFVHNRVRSIEVIARWLRELVPEGSFLVAHGQMHEDRLEQVMADFVAGEADVLICTTIIESGLDIPNVNTIVVHQAQRLGLAQLYQLRGRVGRGATQAYAYLLYDRNQALTDTAQKRLQTVFEATDLGAGFQIALRDLEIRGTGNLLGAEQSGQIGAVGFELYTQLLTEAVEQLRAANDGRAPQPVRRGPSVSVDLPIVAHIPESYIEDVNLRLSLYQQLAAVEDPAELDRVSADLQDRFGPPPAPAATLLRTVRLRTLAARLGAEALQREDDAIALRLAEGLSFSSEDRRAPMPDGVTVGHRLLRVDLHRCGHNWMDVLEDALERLTVPPGVAAG